MKRLFIAILVAVTLTSTAVASVGNLWDATCRITCGTGMGSGCAFAIDQGKVWVITACHVVDEANTVEVEFWRYGHKSQKIQGVVSNRYKDVDIGICTIDVGRFGDQLPSVIPMSPAGMELPDNATIISSGCANGAWQTTWQGHVIKNEVWNNELHFQPVPASGRSGSAILDATGNYIVGVLVGRVEFNRNPEQSYGVATPIVAIRKSVKTSSKTISRWADGYDRVYRECQTVCTPYGCFDNSQQNQGGYLRNGPGIQIGGGQGIQIGPSNRVFPTLPVPQQPQIIQQQPQQQPHVVYVMPNQTQQQPAQGQQMPLPNEGQSVAPGLNIDMSGVDEALKKQAETSAVLADSIKAYVDLQTAKIQKEDTQVKSETAGEINEGQSNEALNKQAEASAGLADSIKAYVDLQTAKLQKEDTQVRSETAGGIMNEAVQGYEAGGIKEGIKYVVQSDATEQTVKSIVGAILPPPFDYIAIFVIGIAFTIFRKIWKKKTIAETASIRREMLESDGITEEDRLEATKAIRRNGSNGNNATPPATSPVIPPATPPASQ